MLDTPLEDGQLASGICFSTSAGNPAVVFDSGEGDVYLYGSTGNVNDIFGIMTAPLKEQISYKLRYDSFNITIDGEWTDEPYSGYIAEITLDDGLYAIPAPYDGGVYDELDLTSGYLLRRCAHINLGDLNPTVVQMDEGTYFGLNLPIEAETEVNPEFSVSPTCTENILPFDLDESFLSDFGTGVYIKLEDGIDITEAKERLKDIYITYARSEEVTEDVETIEDNTVSGTVVIEVLSEVPANIYAIYRT